MICNEKKGGLLLIAEHDGAKLHRISFELLGIAKQLADGTSLPVHALIVGPPGIDTGELYRRGCGTVFYIADPCFKTPEEVLYKENIVSFVRDLNPEIIFFGATNFGRSLAPRVAAALKTGLTADCTGFSLTEEHDLIQIRPAFSDNIFAHIHTVRRPQIATVRYKEFEEAPELPSKNPRDFSPVKLSPVCTAYPRVPGILETAMKEGSISDAEVIVAAGRGIKKREDLSILEELANLLGGRLGASRALVDAGIADSCIQVGYSGHRVKPKLYIAAGISGAPQHLAGMKESQKIIAINTDPSAPIFQIADLGYIGDLYEIIPAMIKKLKERSRK